MNITYTFWESPCGQVVLGGGESGIRFLTLTDPGREHQALALMGNLFPQAACKSDPGPLRPALNELEEFFAGSRQNFTIPLLPEGTKFQQAVWQALREIPYGQVRAYAEVARNIGHPTATRAVGGACGRNPIALFIPCHRVVRTDGSLGGFGCGIERKKWLLQHEGVL